MGNWVEDRLGIKWDPIDDIKNIAGDVGGAISSGAKSVGDFLKDASPVLLPLLAGTILPTLLPTMGGSGGFLGKLLGKKLGGGLFTKIMGGNTLGQIGGKFLEKAAPTLLAKAITKPKSQNDYVDDLMARMPKMSQESLALQGDLARGLSSSISNPTRIEAQKFGAVNPRNPVSPMNRGVSVGVPDVPGAALPPVAPAFDPEEELRRRIQRDRRLG